MRRRLILSGKELKEMFSYATYLLERSASEINSLNVFPVPDGDTGTNMLLTMRSSLEEGLRAQTESAFEVLHALAKGALFGARGNSGLILSQIMRGLAQATNGKKSIDAKDLARAFQLAETLAKKALINPVEGTILTVLKDVSYRLSQLVEEGEEDVVRLLEEALNAASSSVAETPKLLDVLKNAGVVDAGGKGLYVILEGFVRYLKGERIRRSALPNRQRRPEREFLSADLHEAAKTYGYCTEVMLKGKALDPDAIRAELLRKGESLIVVGDSNVVRVHIHTSDPGAILSFLAKLGRMHDISIRNMDDQHREFLAAGEMNYFQDFAILAFVEGDGFAEVLKGLGVSSILNYGGKRRPSLRHALRILDSIPSDRIIILPNRKDLIDFAERLKRKGSKEVRIIPSESPPQGIAAILSYDYSLDFERNFEAMLKATNSIRSIEILTRKEIRRLKSTRPGNEGVFALLEGNELVSGKDYAELIEKIFKRYEDENWQRAVVYYGKDGNPDEAEKIVKAIKERKPKAETEVIRGGQSSSRYLISIE